MKATTAQRRVDPVDLDRVRELVGIADVLRHFGYDARSERGRTVCPIHHGSNPSAFSYTPQVYHCFACSAGGDIFELLSVLRACTFREAIAYAAQLAGLGSGQLPRLTSAAIERQRLITRRRQALRRWRDGRLNEWVALIGYLANDEARLLARYLERDRDTITVDPDADGWTLLASLHGDLQVAENMAATLTLDDEEAWAETWLAEQRREVPTPAELRGEGAHGG